MTNRKRSGALNHTHKYRKVSDVWYCALMHCSHFIPKNIDENAMLGKASICWECGNEMAIDEEALTNEQPICINCRLKKSGVDTDGLAAFLKEKGI